MDTYQKSSKDYEGKVRCFYMETFYITTSLIVHRFVLLLVVFFSPVSELVVKPYSTKSGSPTRVAPTPA